MNIKENKHVNNFHSLINSFLEVHFHTAQQQNNFKPYVGQNWCEKLREAELDMQSYALKIFFH